MARSFTPEQANSMLPLVRRIVEDIVMQYRRWRDYVREFELVTINSRADQPDPRAEGLQQEIARLAADIAGFETELAELGVKFEIDRRELRVSDDRLLSARSYDLGVVDFPSEVGGRPVYLCWRLGEPAVMYWHDRQAGYEGRRPLSRAVA